MSPVPVKRQEPMATAAEVAAYLGGDFSEKTLANWRCVGKGPKYHKVGGRVRYDWADVRAWLGGRSKSGEAAEVAA